MNKYIFIILLISFPVHANWTEDLYQNIQQHITQDYSKEIRTSVELSCVRKVHKYRELLVKNLNSKYYKWKLNVWTNRCKKENINIQ